MNLATRCPSCGTVFRVVPDQLRVSEGWVRCGRCNSVFNAAEVLFDIDNGAAVQIDLEAEPAAPEPADSGAEPTVTDWTAPLSAPQTDRDDGAAGPPGFGPAARHAPGLSAGPVGAAPARTEPMMGPPDAAWAGSQPFGAAQREEPLLRAPSLPSARPDPGFDVVAAAAQSQGEAQSTGSGPSRGAPPAPRSAATRPQPSRPAALADVTLAPPLPSFLRAADHAALWRRPALRSALGIAVLLLAAGLLLQSALLWRDTLAARLPASAPALRALCRLLGCQVQPLRRIDALAVNSSALNRLAGSTLYRLQLVLHNRADSALLAPALDLSLTDAQGKLVARRVLALVDLGLPQSVLQAGQELPITVLMATGEQRVEGYTVELFYP